MHFGHHLGGKHGRDEGVHNEGHQLEGGPRQEGLRRVETDRDQAEEGADPQETAHPYLSGAPGNPRSHTIQPGNSDYIELNSTVANNSNNTNQISLKCLIREDM